MGGEGGRGALPRRRTYPYLFRYSHVFANESITVLTSRIASSGRQFEAARRSLQHTTNRPSFCKSYLQLFINALIIYLHTLLAMGPCTVHLQDHLTPIQISKAVPTIVLPSSFNRCCPSHHHHHHYHHPQQSQQSS